MHCQVLIEFVCQSLIKIYNQAFTQLAFNAVLFNMNTQMAKSFFIKENKSLKLKHIAQYMKQILVLTYHT